MRIFLKEQYKFVITKREHLSVTVFTWSIKRPYRHGFRRHLINEFAKRFEITAFVFVSKIEHYKFVKGNVKILGRRLYSPSLKGITWIEDSARLIFSNFPYICR